VTPEEDKLVFEVAGVWANGGDKDHWVDLREVGDGVALQPVYVTPVLKPVQARRLARQLYRLARRVEKRKGTTT
jgi:hypothetical protein